LLVLLLLFLIGALPSGPHARNWGYAPTGVLGFFAIVILVLMLTGSL